MAFRDALPDTYLMKMAQHFAQQTPPPLSQPASTGTRSS